MSPLFEEKHLGMFAEEININDLNKNFLPCFRYLVALGLENGLIFLYSVTEDLRFTETWKNERYKKNH